MRRRFAQLIRRVAVCGFFASPWAASAQRFAELEPHAFGPIQRYNESVGFYFEGTQEETSYKSGTSSSYQRFFMGPAVSETLSGWLYHPNLVQYTMSADGALGYSEEKITTSNGDSIHRNQVDYLGTLSDNWIFLANKPYRTTLYSSVSRLYRAYDVFNRVTVDNSRFGFGSGYNKGPVPVTVSFSRYDEETDGFSYDTSLRRTTANVDARNERNRGNSNASYTFSQDDRIVNGEGAESLSHSFRVTDREVFGRRRNITWDNSAAFVTRTFDDIPTEDFTASSHLTLEHRPNLTTIYDVNYFRSDGDSLLSENLDTSAGIRHRLFASLTSELRLQALRYVSESPVGDSENTQYGVTWSEAYTKRLSSSARLSISGSLGITHGEQQSHANVRVTGEGHAFGESGPVPDGFLLNVPRVNQSTIKIFDESRAILYREDLDYTVSTAGEQTLIRLIQLNPSGLVIGSRVLVDYEAASLGSGTYDGLVTSAQVRLDLMNGMWGVYGRYESADYSSSEEVVVQDVFSLAFGVDFTRKWLRAGAEYLIYDSTFSAYTTARAFQSLSFTPDEASTLNFEFSQALSQYEMESRTEQYFSFISRYHRALTEHLALDAEAGVRQRFGRDVDQTLAAFRPGIRYVIGKLSIHANYDFDYRLFQDQEERTRQMLSLRIRRSF